MMDHPAVVQHGQGVSSEELAGFTEAMADYAKSRIRGTGNEQYMSAIGIQEFEIRSPEETAEYLMEELADVINYASMLAIKALAVARLYVNRG